MKEKDRKGHKLHQTNRESEYHHDKSHSEVSSSILFDFTNILTNLGFQLK